MTDLITADFIAYVVVDFKRLICWWAVWLLGDDWSGWMW